MPKKVRQGISLYKTILLGEMLRHIHESVYSFWVDKFDKVLLINRFKEEIWFKHIKDEKFRKSNFGPSKLKISYAIDSIKHINYMIIDFNNIILSVNGIHSKIKTFNIKYIKKILRERASAYFPIFTQVSQTIIYYKLYGSPHTQNSSFAITERIDVPCLYYGFLVFFIYIV